MGQKTFILHGTTQIHTHNTGALSRMGIFQRAVTGASRPGLLEWFRVPADARRWGDFQPEGVAGDGTGYCCRRGFHLLPARCMAHISPVSRVKALKYMFHNYKGKRCVCKVHGTRPLLNSI